MLRKGFTLAEMIVIITIITIISGVSMTAFYQAKNRQGALIIAEDIKSFFDEAHSLAMHPEGKDSLKEVRIEYQDAATSEFKMIKVKNDLSKETVKTLVIDQKYNGAVAEIGSAVSSSLTAAQKAAITDPYKNIYLAPAGYPFVITFESPSGRVTDFYNPNIQGELKIWSDQDSAYLKIDPLSGLVTTSSVK